VLRFVEHLVEVFRRQLYLEQACGSLNKYCQERLGYSEDGALKRARVAKLALRFPRALDELRNGAIHLTGLFLLSAHLTAENADALFVEARGKSRRELERLLAARFPRPDLAPKVQALGATPSGNADPLRQDATSGPSFQLSCPETVTSDRPRIEPLSAERHRYEFSAGAAFHAKLDAAYQVFGEAFIAEKRAARADQVSPEQRPQPDVFDKVHFALCEMGFRQREVERVLSDLRREHSEAETEPLLRAASSALTPARICRGSPSG
jgi:hypothetical protein